MAPFCEICNVAEAKYKCPSCSLRYCSLTCYKPHKAAHELAGEKRTVNAHEEQIQKVDRPGTKQRVAKPTFEDFENDEEFQRLLKRYPKLKYQLQGIFALTLDPGPDEQRSWCRPSFPMIDRTFTATRGGDRGRGRGRGRGGRGSNQRGGMSAPPDLPEGRQRGIWSQEKGDQEATYLLRKVQDDCSHEDLAEGLQEFVELVKMRFES